MNRVLKLLGGLAGAGLIVVAIFGFIYQQEVIDWWRLRGYDPPSNVVALANDTTMTPEARRFFYASRPTISNRQEFNESCHVEELSIVLGCYISNDGIYIYNVKDKRLDGVHQVTAAHEMLHAAYDRLIGKERQRIDNLTRQAFKNVSNERIKKMVADYEANDATSVPNELHSILGTEVSNLPSELEDYYKKYFINRQTVVNFSKQYEANFSSRQQRITALDRQIKALKLRIDQNQATLSAQKAQIQNKRQTLDGLRQSDPEAYNAMVADFNARINTYNQLISQTQNLIKQHNELVDQLNDLAFEIRDLYQAIDSSPQKIK